MADKRRIKHDLQGLGVLILALALGGFLLLSRLSSDPVIAELPRGTDASATGTALTATPRGADWQQVIQQQIVNGATPIPTINIPRPSLTPPLTVQVETPAPNFWEATPTAQRFVPASGPTLPPPTAVAGNLGGPEVRRNPDPRKGQFSPPPVQVPLSLDPRDHFWFKRPVDSSANSSEIYWYVYGSDGPQNAWRVHHGVDLPNPLGKEVKAAAAGRVVWASDNYVWRLESGRTESAYTYGNVVIIVHDFGWQGKRLYTLYAHLQLILTKVDDYVEQGQTIGLSGNTGVVSGPHVHFEVRVGENWYFATRNPVLWMAPYEGHGVIAGRILYPNGAPVEDVTVTLYQNGRVIDSTTTYVQPKWTNNQRAWNVVPDEVWRENFVIGDVPAGKYQIAVNVNGVRYTKDVTVRAATTSFVDFNRVESIPTPAG